MELDAGGCDHQTIITTCRDCGEVLDPERLLQIIEDQRIKVRGLEKERDQQRRRISKLQGEQNRQLKASKHYLPAIEVLTYWKETLHPEAREIHEGERVKNVMARLKGSYSVEQLKRCVDGYAHVPYVVNARRASQGTPGTRRIDAELIFRDPQHVDNGLAYAAEAEQRAQPLPRQGKVTRASTAGLSSLGTAAVSLAEFGFYVFPVVPRGKAPATPHGFKNASRDVEAIIRYWQLNPEHNIGIRCGIESNLVVLDVDGSDGLESLRKLINEYDELPETASIVTPSGGSHYYFRHPGQGTIQNTQSYPGVGLDIRGDGGYVLGTPSVGASGKMYVVDNSIPIAKMPIWFIKLLADYQAQMNTINPTDFEKIVRQGVVKGQRDAQLTRLTGHLFRRGHPPGFVLGMVASVNEARCSPPLANKQIKKIVDSIARRETRRNSPIALPLREFDSI